MVADSEIAAGRGAGTWPTPWTRIDATATTWVAMVYHAADLGLCRNKCPIPGVCLGDNPDDTARCAAKRLLPRTSIASTQRAMAGAFLD